MSNITIEQLLSKAKKVDDLLVEAVNAELYLIHAAASVGSLGKPDSGDGAAALWMQLTDDATDKTSVVDMVSGFAKVESSFFGDLAADMDNVINDAGSDLGGLAEDIDDIQSVMTKDTWDGEAARAFTRNHVNKYGTIIAQQSGASAELHSALLTARELMKGVYSSLYEVLATAVAALEAIIDSAETQARNITVAALALVVSVVAVPFTAGGSAGMVFAIAGGAVSVGGASLSAGGATTDEVHSSIRESIAGLRAHVEAVDEELATKLEEDVQLIELRLEIPSSSTLTPMEIPRPAFADEPSKF